MAAYQPITPKNAECILENGQYFKRQDTETQRAEESKESH
jgi:hypothetical protein